MKFVFICFFSLLFTTDIFANKLIISVASSMTDALNEIGALYKKSNPNTELFFNFASSGSLRSQIEKGAPVDIFFSASPKHIDILESRKLILTGSRYDLVTNSLVLVGPINSKFMLNQLSELGTLRFKRLGIGAPLSVPAGFYAEQVLLKLGLWDKLKDQLIMGGNVRQVLDYVARDEVDLGIVYLTDALLRSNKVKVLLRISGDLHSNIVYPVAILNSSKVILQAQDFIRFTKSSASKRVFQKYGFSVK